MAGKMIPSDRYIVRINLQNLELFAPKLEKIHHNPRLILQISPWRLIFLLDRQRFNSRRTPCRIPMDVYNWTFRLHTEK